MHAPSQPLMRSLLSQFQTPTSPRRVSRCFGVWLPIKLPWPVGIDGLVISGSSVVRVNYPAATGTILQGINYWGSIVGIWSNLNPPFSGPSASFELKHGATAAWPAGIPLGRFTSALLRLPKCTHSSHQGSRPALTRCCPAVLASVERTCSREEFLSLRFRTLARMVDFR